MSTGDCKTLKRNLGGISKDYIRERGHEAFPIVSLLWKRIMFDFSTMILTKMENRKNELSKQLLFYYANSEMFPNRTKTEDVLRFDSTSSMERHLEKCKKSALILSNQDAILLYITFKVKKKPVYYGKNDSLWGYISYGYFARHLLH